MKLARLFLLLSSAVIAALFLFQFTPKNFNAQTGKGNAPCCGPTLATGPREIDFPYYSLRDGFNSTLYLVSDSPQDIPLTIAIRSLAGQTVLSPSTIGPMQRLSFDLRALLIEQGADPSGGFAEGSVAVYYTGTIMPVVGQITISNPVTHLVHESELQENDPGRSDIPTVQNGLWWGLSGGRDARIMVSNTRGVSVVADVFLDFLGKPHQVSQSGVAFMPHETKVLSVTDMLGQLGFSPAQVPQGGITIMARGGVGGLMAQGKILDPATGFSTTLRFPSPDTQIRNALHAEGIPIGKPSKDSPYVGMGVFTPHVALRNLTDSAQTVTLTIEYPEGAFGEKAKKFVAQDPPSGPAAPPATSEEARYTEFDGEGGETTGQLTLAPLNVPAHSTEEFSLLSALGELPLPIPYASVRIQFSGPPNAIIGELASVDEVKDLVVDSRVVNEGWSWMGSGANPWHLDDQTESILFLTDMGDQPARMGFIVSSGDVHQNLAQLQLQPHETRAINLRKLRDTQRADLTGVKIPADASDGVVHWGRIDNQPVAGRVVIFNRRSGVASNYDCCTCPCPMTYYQLVLFMYQGGSLLPAPSTINLGTGQGVDLYAMSYYKDCNNVQYIDFAPNPSWETYDSSVATVSGGHVTAVGGGSTTVKGSASGCSSYNGNCNCLNSPIRSAYITVNVVALSQSPSQFNMSTGDTGHISVTVTPSGVPVTLSFNGTSSPTSNPNSSGAVTLTISGSGSGTINSSVTASPAGNSGVYSVRATSQGVTSSNSTTINIPPQVLIQMMYGEADGAGSTAQLAVGVAARNRFNDSTYFAGDSNYQNTITSTQFNGIATNIANGVSPELANAASVWLGQTSDFITPSGGYHSQCFWTPSAAEWSQISAAVQSGTSNEAQVPNRTGCYSGAPNNQQIRVVTAVGTNSSGVPWFVFQGPRSSGSSPVAIQM